MNTQPISGFAWASGSQVADLAFPPDEDHLRSREAIGGLPGQA
jgi:hypothetical protein